MVEHMTEPRNEPELDQEIASVNSLYASGQLAKALTTATQHQDPDIRARAVAKIQKWEKVILGFVTGSIKYGSRTPIADAPPWATLEVVKGGFATGNLLASGPILDHELKFLSALPSTPNDSIRRTLNGYFLTDEGLQLLQNLLQTNCYDVNVPEEGALLVVAWLISNGYAEQARNLLELIAPFFDRLRFYPVPLDAPRRSGWTVRLQNVGETITNLGRIQPNRQVLAQKEAVEVWAPFQDRMIDLFLETVVDDWPCAHFPDGWAKRASTLEYDYQRLRQNHSLCGKPERTKGHFAQLKRYLARCARDPQSLTGRDVGRIRLILNRYVEKRGQPNSKQCTEKRMAQQADVAAPLFYHVAQVVKSRMAKLPADRGLDNVETVIADVDENDSLSETVPPGTSIPAHIQRKVQRCLNETITELVNRGVITSGESVARVLPQFTSGIRAAGICSSQLSQLYSAIYRAFRRRRSLLLLNLEKQVQIEELPWIAAIDQFRYDDMGTAELAELALEEIVVLVISAFPHVILPNKLLQELTALVKTSGHQIPLVEEVAADIFMGQFSDKFPAAARQAADLLDGTLYARYYDINYDEVREIKPQIKPQPNQVIPRKQRGNPFAKFCAKRAGVPLGTWNPATNGMIIEQQQIITTHNLAPLFAGLNLTHTFQDQLVDLAQRCFKWTCRRLQTKAVRRHARLISVKNSAYAWRQMIFYLALADSNQLQPFIKWATDHLANQRQDFAEQFRPALTGLELVAAGHSIDNPTSRTQPTTRFLGWNNEQHWLVG